MSDYFECTKVGLEFLEQTKNVFKAEEIVRATPEQVFEEFIAWERGKRMAFTFLGCSKNATEKFLEDYRVTDLGDGTCRVEWYMAMDTRGVSRNLMWLTRPVIGWANRRMFKKFKTYTEAYVADSAAAAV
jgi:hypothetical protein